MKSITVKGIGKASVKPDYVVLSLLLETADKNYETAMDRAAEKIAELNKSLEAVGFEKESVKTTDFNVRAEYDSKKDSNGDYCNVFCGYSVSHRLKVSFDFDTKLLAKVLGTVTSCVAAPELSVDFTVKNASAVNEMLLKSAAENARKKAEILCAASGAKLGEIVTIDYNWSELNLYSRTRYALDEDCEFMMKAPTGIDIEPDDIRVSDSVTFVWEIG